MLKLSLALTLLLASSGNLAMAKKRVLLKGGDRFLQDTPPPGTPSQTPPAPPESANTTQPEPPMPTVSMGDDGSGTSIPHHKNLPCFSCIMSDNIFCVNAPDQQQIKQGDSLPEAVCCDSTDPKPCPQQFLPGWTCSNSYSDKLMSLRMCPFVQERCGNQSEIIFGSPGDKLNQNLTFYPGDVCFFTLRTECGLPSFDPQGSDASPGVDIFTIEYDDQDVASEVISTNETNATGTNKRIPIPKKRENFDGSAKQSVEAESYLQKKDKNENGTISYYYSNGTVVTLDDYQVVEFPETDTREIEIQYSNGTTITFIRDGSKEIQNPGATKIVIPPPGSDETQEESNDFSFEDSTEEDDFNTTSGFGSGRLLQTTNTTISESKPWGIIYFYMDGRIRELLANGTSRWNTQFFDVSANPNTTDNSTVNSTVHLKVQVWTNGSYILGWIDGSQQAFMNVGNWSKVYFQRKAEFAKQIKRLYDQQDGSKTINFLNGTERYIAPPLTNKNTKYQNATALSYVDSYQTDDGYFTRQVFRNGTVVILLNFAFQYYEVEPTSFAPDFKRIDYTDGSYVLLYEVSGRKVFYPPPPKKGLNSTYDIATAVLSIENIDSGTQRVVYANGTIVIYSPESYAYEVEPTAYFEAIVTEWGPANCQFVVYNYIHDTKTKNFCPVPSNSTEKTIAFALTQETTFRDGSTRRSYANGTIARFSPNNTLAFYEVPPKSFFLEFPITRAPDGSITIDYTAANKTKRFIPARPNASTATPQMEAVALNYKDIYQNGTQRAFYLNGTIAILNAKNALVYYEKEPEWFFGGCRPGYFSDDRTMINCLDVNGTMQLFYPPLTFRNTAYENATAPLMDEILKDSSFIRYYRNGTQVKYHADATIEAVLIPPTSMAQPSADFNVTEYDSGIKIIHYTNGTAIVYNAPLTGYSTNEEIAVSLSYWIVRPDKLTTYYFRNGSILLMNDYTGNSTWIVPPRSYYVDYQIVNNTDGTQAINYVNGTSIKEQPAPASEASEAEKACAVLRITEYGNGTDVWSFRNGTVAVYENGVFARYIIPPKSYFITITIQQNDDGSYFRFFSNGTQQWFAAPPTANETAEIKAFRINSIISDPNGIQTFFYANGTVAVFNGTDFVKHLVKPTSFFVTRQVIINPDGGFVEEFSNGTTIRYSAIVDERADELVRAFYITKEELNADGSGKRFFLNGTIIATKDGNFTKYIVPPRSLYKGCVKSLNPEGQTQMRCWNNTIRTYPAFKANETEEDRATGLLYIEQDLNTNAYVYYFRNGTIYIWDPSRGPIYIKAPSSFYVSNTTNVLEDGTIKIEFSNNTVVFKIPPPKKEDTPYSRAIAEETYKDFQNGTVEIKYVNGTHVRRDRNENGTYSIYYIRRPEGFAQEASEDNSASVSFNNGTQRQYFPAVAATASDYEKAVAAEFQDTLADGSFIITYFNGTVVHFYSTGELKGYIKKPEYLYGDVQRQDFTDGSFALLYRRNRTVRVFPAPIPATASKKEKSLALFYFDKFSNGTVTKHFQNGTVATYHNGIFIRYESKPQSFYSEQDFQDFPIEYNADGSKSIYYPNGTVRNFGPEGSEKIYSDCLDNGTCTVFYRNGTIARWDQDTFVGAFTPKPQGIATTQVKGADPNYKYVNKTGPKKQVYDKSQGGKKKYKEDYQNNDNRGLKSEPTEPICKGRNQMIIMGDWRVKMSIYANQTATGAGRRVLELVDSSNEGPSILALQMESISFIPDSPSSSDSQKLSLVAALGMILSFSLLFF